MDQKKFQEGQVYPEAIEYGIKEEDGAKFYYSKVSEKQHCSFEFEEPGLIISRHYSWIGASLDGIRKCQCCDPTVVEINAHLKGNTSTLKLLSCYLVLVGKKMKMGGIFSTKITYIIFKFRLACQFQVCKPVILSPIQVKAYLLLKLILMLIFGKLLWQQFTSFIVIK